MTTMTRTPPDTTGRDRATTWVGVCTLRQLVPERGAAVLVRGRQLALFRIPSAAGPDHVRAVGHQDPASGANVMARGIVGSVRSEDVDGGQRDTVASPMYKDVYDLATGECLTRPELRLPVHRTWVAGGIVYVEVADGAAV
jgi:nitrite reductase/ring-hydroxylating ferredoxin subunit